MLLRLFSDGGGPSRRLIGSVDAGPQSKTDNERFSDRAVAGAPTAGKNYNLIRLRRHRYDKKAPGVGMLNYSGPRRPRPPVSSTTTEAESSILGERRRPTRVQYGVSAVGRGRLHLE